MRKPGAPAGHFQTLSLAAVFNRSRSDLPSLLRPPVADDAFGDRTIRGIPFAFGLADGKNVVVLDSSSLRIDLPEVTATYCIFVHAVADAPTNYGVEFSDSAADGNQVGGVVSEYSLVYVDGSSVAGGVLRLPERSRLNAIGELDGVTVDLGTVISARAARDYDPVRWLGNEPLVKPARSGQSVVVEFAAHPEATLSVANEAVQGHDIKMLPASDKPVPVRIVEGETGAAAPARVHFHGQAGEYFPPRGHHRKVNTALFEDTFAELAVDDHQFAYVDGDCIVDLPIGTVFVEIARGYETTPIRRAVTGDASTKELRF